MFFFLWWVLVWWCAEVSGESRELAQFCNNAVRGTSRIGIRKLH